MSVIIYPLICLSNKYLFMIALSYLHKNGQHCCQATAAMELAIHGDPEAQREPNSRAGRALSSQEQDTAGCESTSNGLWVPTET